MLEGRNVNLRILEKEDLSLFVDGLTSPRSLVNTILFIRCPRRKQRMLDNPAIKPFIIEKKDGGKIGFIFHFHVLHLGTGTKQLEIGYTLLPSERGKGYCTEAIMIIVDYLFLSKDTMRIQAQTDQRNAASHKVLEKVGFTKEGTLRNNFFIRGEWTDDYIYSIIRQEWKEPKILTKNCK